MPPIFQLVPWILLCILAIIGEGTNRRWRRRCQEAEAAEKAATIVAEGFLSGQLGPRDWFNDVLEFHHKFGAPIAPFPWNPTANQTLLRRALISEEIIEELFPAMDKGDLTEIADAIADSIYVLLGTAAVYGIDIRSVWKAVHLANMKKMPYDSVLAAAMLAEGKKVRIGKIMKPAGWTPPDIRRCLRLQAPLEPASVALPRTQLDTDDFISCSGGKLPTQLRYDGPVGIDPRMFDDGNVISYPDTPPSKSD